MHSNMEKPSEQMLVEHPETMNNILGHETHHRDTIFGILYRLAFGTIVFNGGNAKNSKTPTCLAKIKQFLPLIVIIPIFIRTFHLIGQVSQSTLLTKNWAITLSMLVTSIHGIVAVGVLFYWNNSNFIEEFAHKIHVFLKAREKQIDPKSYRSAHILAILFMLFYMCTWAYFSVENFIFNEEHQNNPNSTAFYRNSLTGNIAFWPVDSVIIMWTSFVSSALLCFFYLLNHSLIVETEKFNTELREAGENGQLKYPDLLNNYVNRHLDLISIVKFANEKFNPIITPSLLFFVFCHFLNVFVMRGYETELVAHQKILSITLMISSLLAILITIKKPAGLYTQIQTTKNIIFFEKSIWIENDLKLITAANTIIDRITKADFTALIFEGIVIKEKCFHIIFFAAPLLVEILVFWKRMN